MKWEKLYVGNSRSDVVVGWFDVEEGWFEVVVGWFEVVVGWFEVEVGWFDVIVGWFDGAVLLERFKSSSSILWTLIGSYNIGTSF